ncbi:MAG: glutamate formimidoyltransferase [Candidatus Bipolaricaulis sp.]|nr:glutamate formimidoyltransferase [Candidatus Bipolaricaulis sp.]
MIECVANISEGRSAAAIEKIAAALRLTGAALLDVHVDPDHHRSVLTLAGEPPAVEDAALALARECVARIDLRRHSGVHPRMGALDVLPFVPLAASSMADCVRIARHTGARIAAELEVPVYLYGEAASSPARRSLSFVRGHGLETLARRMREEEFAPDFGPCRPHPTAGATAVGARGALVAYNVRLDTSDVAVARRIAAAIREAQGGLRGVQALGLPLMTRGCTQVSMNLIGPSLPRVVDVFRRVRELAESSGVAVTASELVGLAPSAALEGATRRNLRLDDEPSVHVLETRLAEVNLA